MNTMRRTFSLLFAAFALAACGSPNLKVGSLYQRLGGHEAIVGVVDDFVLNLKADPRVRDSFQKTDVARFKEQFAEQLCAVSNGPCEYRGRSMAEAHRALKVTNVEFDAFIGDLAKALDRHDVKPAEQRELLFALKAMRAEVLGLPPG